MHPKHLYSLDIARGLASLAVVIWHYWQFFYPAPGSFPAVVPDSSFLPFDAVLWPLYHYGYHAVDLFFGISGFVFFYLYSEPIHERSVTWREFWWLRFSRLYPLHFVTLLYVAGMQLAAKAELGTFIIYPDNTLRHFLLNLFFASDWGLQWGPSFNAPIWSVSIEILLYAVFFLVALCRPSPIIAALMSAAGVAMFSLGAKDLGTGLTCFFAGGLAFFWCEWIGRPAWAFLEAGRPLKLIGEITYSTYLLHFPIQLTVLVALMRFNLRVDFAAPIFLLAYLAAVIGLSIPCYYYFEMPAQRFLRRLGLGRRAAVASA